jgi:triphosphatase
MSPSERLRLLGGRPSVEAIRVVHLPPTVVRMPLPERGGEAQDRASEPDYGAPDRSWPREPARPADPLPNPFLAIDPVLPVELRAPGRAAPAHGTNADQTRRAPFADEVGVEPLSRADARLPTDSASASETQAIVPRIEPAQVGFEPPHRSSQEIVRRSRVGPTTGSRPRVDEPAGASWSRASKLRLTPEMTAAQAFGMIVTNSLSHLTANQDCARLNLHIEGVHQCRIALRRLRSAFKIFRPVLRRELIHPIEQDVRAIAKILGTARDFDVLQAELVVPAAQALGESDELATLINLLEAKKTAAYDAVGQALTCRQYRRLLSDLGAIGTDHPGPLPDVWAGADQPATALASSALTRAHRKLLKRGGGFETLSEAQRHEVRIALKRLRYALDFFSSLFDGGVKKKYMRRTARLQDGLGRMNDLAAARRLLAQLAGLADDGCQPREAVPGTLAFTAGGILGWHRRDAAQTDRRLVKDWSAFVQSAPFWSR